MILKDLKKNIINIKKNQLELFHSCYYYWYWCKKSSFINVKYINAKYDIKKEFRILGYSSLFRISYDDYVEIIK